MDRETREERQARAAVTRAILERGEASVELLDAWREARRREAEALVALGVEEAQRVLSGEVQALESDLSALEGREAESSEAAFEQVLAVGSRLRWVLWLVDVISEERLVDPLTLVEEEAEKIRAHARDLVRLDSRLRELTEGVERESDEVTRELHVGRLDRYLRGRAPPGAVGVLDEASAHWLATAESFQIESDLRLPHAEPGPSPGGAPRVDLTRLRNERERHTASCAGALERCTAGEVAEFAHTAIVDLLDHGSTLLAEGEGTLPESRLQGLALLCEQIDTLLGVLGSWPERLRRSGDLDEEDRRRLRQELRQVAKMRRQTRSASTEARVSQRMERLLGRRGVHLLENLILVLILSLLGLVFFEWRLPEDGPAAASWYDGGLAIGVFTEMVAHEAIRYFNFVDLGFCIVFQVDFFLRWALAAWGLSYFLRHFFFESLPALPYGFIVAHPGAMEEARAVILVRLVRLRRVLSLRALVMVFLRAFRVIAFFSRGLDRAIEKFRPVLDRDIVLFDPDPTGDTPESPLRRRAMGLVSRRVRVANDIYGAMEWDERAERMRRHGAMLGAEGKVAAALDLPYRRGLRELEGEVHIERVIHDLLDCDVTQVLGVVGRDGVQRIARWLHFFDTPILRGLPVFRRLVSSARLPNPADAVAAAAHAVGQLLQQAIGLLRFWGDLSGITTGPQVLDRVGTAIVTASKRPAMRLITVGGMFLLVEVLAAPFPWLEFVAQKLFRILGLPILILGSVCLVFLLVGRWFKRISGEALDLYIRTADAQFYPLIKAWKFLRHEDDLAYLYRSVLQSEYRLRGQGDIRDEEWLEFLAEPIRERGRFMPGARRVDDFRFAEFVDDSAVVSLLYRDFLDGPVLHRSDDKASRQILGNLSVQSVRTQTLQMSLREVRKLERLDLDRGSILTLGPYFWFRFITESLAIETAKLIMEYSATCIPRDQLHLASDGARERFDRFLSDHRERVEAARLRRQGRGEPRLGDSLTVADFTALDFLGPTPRGDARIEERYGPEVLDALRRDRRAVVREVFGTQPYHLLPRHQRTVNPYRIYRRYLGGARFLLLPVIAILALARLGLVGVSQVRDLVDEVLGRRRGRRIRFSRIAGFDVAVRKINRMRKPLFIEALRVRAAIDVEYLGLRQPGRLRDEGIVTYAEDLDSIGAVESERRPIEELRRSMQRDLGRLRSYLADRGWWGDGLDRLLGELDPTGELRRKRAEVVRAVITAYVTDHDGLRSTLTARERSRSFVEAAVGEKRRTFLVWLWDLAAYGLLRFLPSQRRRRRIFREYVRLDPRLRALSPVVRRRARIRFLRASRQEERFLTLALAQLGDDRGTGEREVKEALKRAACDYRLWTRKLVTVRTIQALTVLDVQRYRDMVREVGLYDEDGSQLRG